MLAPDRSNFRVRVAERAERETAGIPLLCSTAGRLLPFIPVLVCTEQIRELSLGVIEHGSFVNDPALSDQLVRESTETGLAIVGMFAATLCFKVVVFEPVADFILKWRVISIERPSASALPLPPPGLAPAPPSPPPPELAPLSAPPASPGLAPLSAPPASPGLAPAPQPTVAVSGLVQLLDITQFVDALSLPLAKRDRLLEALKAFSTRYGQCSARKFPYSKLDEDRFVRGIEWAYANRQNDI